MTSTFHTLIAAIAISLLTGACTSDIDIPDEGAPVIVVNLLAQSDSILSASITHSWPHSLHDRPDVTVSDAVATLLVNGSVSHTLTYNESTRTYVSGYRPAQGDRIEISVTSPTYGSAYAMTEIPRKVPIDNYSFIPVEVTDYNGIVSDGTSLTYLRTLEIRYSITFTDPADQENYYLISGRVYHENGGGTCSDPILNENDSPLDLIFSSNKSFVVFSDRSINGKTYTLNYTCTYTPFIPVVDFEAGRLTDRIAVCSISRDYYLYLLSIYKKYGELNSNLENFGLTEPKQIFTNITNGAGIAAAMSSDTICNDVHDIVCDFFGIDL